MRDRLFPGDDAGGGAARPHRIVAGLARVGGGACIPVVHGDLGDVGLDAARVYGFEGVPRAQVRALLAR